MARPKVKIRYCSHPSDSLPLEAIWAGMEVICGASRIVLWDKDKEVIKRWEHIPSLTEIREVALDYLKRRIR